jgi:ribonuclease G
VLARFKQLLEKDRTKTEVLNFSKLGLLEMTRKNVSDGIVGTLCKTCPCCSGTGFVKSEETIRLDVERKIRKVTRESSSKAFLVKLNPNVASLTIGKGGKNLRNLEAITKKYIAIKGDDSLPMDSFILEAEGSISEIIEASKPFKVGDILDMVIEEPYSNNKLDAISRIDGNLVQILDGRKFMGQRVRVEIMSMAKTSATAKVIQK